MNSNVSDISNSPETKAKAKAKAQGPQGLIKGYLMAYNQLSFLGWAWILLLTVGHLVENNFDYTGVYSVVWKYLPAVQTAAALEVPRIPILELTLNLPLTLSPFPVNRSSILLQVQCSIDKDIALQYPVNANCASPQDG